MLAWMCAADAIAFLAVAQVSGFIYRNPLPAPCFAAMGTTQDTIDNFPVCFVLHCL